MSADAVRATLEVLLAADPDVADRDEVAAVVRRSREMRSFLDSVDLRCARRTRELAAQGRAEPADSMLGDQGQRSSSEAGNISKRVPACDAMPKFEAALAAGLISGGHVDAVADVLRNLDDEIRLEFIAEQDALLAAAQRESVEQFRSGCRNLVRFLIAQRDSRTGADTEMEELARQRAASKIRQWADKQTGMHHTHVELDPVRGAKLKKALADMLRRHRAQQANAGVPWNQLEVDSFLSGIDRAVTTRPAPSGESGATSQPTSTTRPRTTSEPATTNPTPTEPAGTHEQSVPGSHEHMPVDDMPVDDMPVDDMPVDDIPDDVSDDDGDGTPGSPVDLRVPDIGVFIDMRTLIHGLHEQGICETYDGIAVPVSEVRRMCCDANIIPYVLNGKGEVTDLGRSTRTLNRAQRRKLRAMHKTCVGDDCHVSFEQCQIHHIIFWRFTGRTDISNLVPVCSRHHHLAHEGGWTLAMTSDRVVTWTRPDGTIHSVHNSIDRTPRGRAGRRRARAVHSHPPHTSSLMGV